MLTASQIAELQQAVFQWYYQHQRKLWWRQQPTPYVVLVSEMMLQQTQVSKVAPKLRQFLQRFPSFEVLAAASLEAVLRAWQGLGYNRRALYLWRIAQVVQQRFGGKLPSNRDLLQQLPGIGAYTAAAIRVFAFDLPDVILDTNIKRIISRLFFTLRYRNEVMPISVLREKAAQLQPESGLRQWYYALMDLGSLLCRSTVAHCDRCPLQSWCVNAGKVNELPVYRRQRKEPVFQGIPRRIWRGRIVELLRQHSGLSIEQILRHLQLCCEEDAQLWVEKVLQQLQRERLVDVQINRSGVPMYVLGRGEQ